MARERNAGPPAAALTLLALVCALGCAVHRGVRPGGGDAAATPASRGELISARDRARVEELAAARSRALPDEGYRIGPDDLLEIRIPDLLDTQSSGATPRSGQGNTDVPAMTGAPIFQQGLRVAGDGYVTLPMLGRVPVRGLTTSELESDLAHRLVEEDILRRPEVSVNVAEYRSHVVGVTGSVERPGLYPLTRPGATLADLIRAAGGPNREAGRVVEFVPAADDSAGGCSPIRLDLDALLNPGALSGSLPQLQARPGDVVNLVPAGSVLVDGWVDKPGSYPVTRGLTVSGALAAAGGQLFPADRRRATVKRMLGSGEDRSFKVDLEAVAHGGAPDAPVVDGDVISLPASKVRLVPWGVWNVAREMIHVGGSVLLF